MLRSKMMRWGGALLVAAALVQAGGCGNATPEPAPPPDIPPQSTMVMNVGEFDSDAKIAGEPTARIQQPLPGTSFLYAGTNVVIWNTIIVVTLAVPVAAFAESFNHTPEQLDNGVWQWSYSYTFSGVEYSAKLQADVGNNGVDWFMLISKEGAYTDYEWFTGHSNLAGTEGAWTLNHAPGNDPANPEPFVFIEWERDAEGETAQIKYTNITPDAPENGGYIEYGVTDNATYDAFYTIASAGDDHTINVEVNLTTFAGRVRDEIHFNDTDWHCWDEDQQNADCP